MEARAYQELMRIFRSEAIVLNPKAQKIIKGRCQKIVDVTTSLDWEYSGVEQKESSGDIYLSFNKPDMELLVDPFYPGDSIFPKDYNKPPFSAYIYPSGKFKPAIKNNFILVESKGNYFLSITKSFNRKTLKKAEKLLKKQQK